MVSRQMYRAVIFNPVPGPPMGRNTRLTFRYWLDGTDTIRVQIYSLSNGYHRHLVASGLAQRSWARATVDMTQARRADGTGGPLAENERIDDIQLYADADAEIVIDDIVLYDAAVDGESRPFPERILFCGVFDTGRQGHEWPGDFEIVTDAGSFGKAARSVTNAATGSPWIRVRLRGLRSTGDVTRVAFRYRLSGADELRVVVANSSTGMRRESGSGELRTAEWAEATVELAMADLASIDEVHFLAAPGAELLIDDLLIYVPAR
jgi:hypothetical protein